MNTPFLGLRVPDGATRDREPGLTIADSMTAPAHSPLFLPSLRSARPGSVQATLSHRSGASHEPPVAWASRTVLELRAAIGFVFGIVALFIGAIALLTYWYVYRRP